MPGESVATGSEIWESQGKRDFVLHSLNASVRGSGTNCGLAMGGCKSGCDDFELMTLVVGLRLFRGLELQRRV